MGRDKTEGIIKGNAAASANSSIKLPKPRFPAERQVGRARNSGYLFSSDARSIGRPKDEALLFK